jgi:hypothetical protein
MNMEDHDKQRKIKLLIPFAECMICEFCPMQYDICPGDEVVSVWNCAEHILNWIN